MKHKLKLSFWAAKNHVSSKKQHVWGTRAVLVSLIFVLMATTLLPMFSVGQASANADTMKGSLAVKKLAAYNTLLYCSTGFSKEISDERGTYISTFDWAPDGGSPTGYLQVPSNYREGSLDGNEPRDFIAIIKGVVDVTNFASLSGSYSNSSADVGLCGANNLKTIFDVLAANASAQDVLCKLGYEQKGMKSITNASCKPANGTYDSTKDLFTISGSIDVSAFKPSSLLSSAASHYVRQIFYITGSDKGGCDASDASDGQYGSGYEIQNIYDYNGTSIASYPWKKKVGCNFDTVVTDQNSQGVKDFMSALDIQLADEATAKCQTLFPTNGSTSDQIRSQVAEKVAACVAGTKNQDDTTYCTTKYAKKTDYNTAKDLQDACAQGQGVTLTGDESGGTTNNDPCAYIPSDTPFSWLACAVFTAVQSMVDGMQTTMTDILYTDANTMFQDTSPIKNASDVLRNVGIALIVITGLIMIIAQATGAEVFDAYTVKKVLPRLGIALIGIALAWPLLKLAVTLSNDLGFAVRDLFDKFAQATATGGGTSANLGTNIGGVITTFLSGSAVVAALGVWGAILLAVSLIISYITGLIVLFMQKMLLVALVMVAPLAIASSVLPGTDKFWKLWRTNILKVLAMFLVIIGIIKIGDVMAAASFAANLPLMAFGAKIATLVLTFKAPQFAGQMLGGFMGMMSGAAYKMASGLKAPVNKMRQQNTQQRNHELAEGSRFRNTTGIGRFANSVTRGAALIPKGIEKGGLLNPATFARHYQSANSQATFDKAEELRSKNADFMSGMQDDNVLWALMRGGNKGMTGIRRELAKSKSGAELEEAVRTAERMYNSGDHRAVMTAAAMHQATTGTGYKDVGQMLETIATTSGGDVMLGQRMLGSMRGLASQSGRYDLGGAGFGATAGVLKKVYDNGTNGEYKAEEGWTRMLQRDALNSVDANTLARQRGESARNLSAAAQEFIEANASNPTNLSLTEVEAGVNNANGEQISETFTVEGVQAAQARMAATLENLEAATRNYGATARAHEVHSVGMDGTTTTREAMHGEQEYKDHIGTYNDPEYRRRAAMVDEGK